MLDMTTRIKEGMYIVLQRLLLYVEFLMIACFCIVVKHFLTLLRESKYYFIMERLRAIPGKQVVP
jgi:hypothetical protein